MVVKSALRSAKMEKKKKIVIVNEIEIVIATQTWNRSERSDSTRRIWGSVAEVWLWRLHHPFQRRPIKLNPPALIEFTIMVSVLCFFFFFFFLLPFTLRCFSWKPNNDSPTNPSLSLSLLFWFSF